MKPAAGPADMSRRDVIRMSEAEIEAFLAEPGHTLQLATINADGTPHLVAMSYCLQDARIVLWSYAKAQKVVNLRRDPRLTVLVESGQRYEELRGVQIGGIAVLVEDAETVRRIGERITEFAGGGEVAMGAVPKMAAKRVAILVKPERVISWDHSKLLGAY
ncbi:MAG: pyridoxamine 5'-phosphate oxidase family protein [Actinomycetota bacterium]